MRVTGFGRFMAQASLISRIAIPRMLPSDYGNCVGALFDVSFRGSIPNLYIPLSTLHVPPYGVPAATVRKYTLSSKSLSHMNFQFEIENFEQFLSKQ